jgi:hypothetical protein
MHGSLVLPQVVNAFEDFLANMTSLRVLPAVLDSDMAGKVLFPHLLRAMWTAGHYASYKVKVIYSDKLYEHCASVPLS